MSLAVARRQLFEEDADFDSPFDEAETLTSITAEPASIDVCGEPTALACDRVDGALYIATRDGAVLRVRDGRQAELATIEEGSASTNRIGGLAVTPYGTVYASRVGYGRAGAIVRVEPSGERGVLERLAPRHWRLGLVYDPHDHVLYTTQYFEGQGGPCQGSIGMVDLEDGYASPVLDGFGKPVAITRLEHMLVVADSRRQKVYRVDLAQGRAIACTELADIEQPDSICACGPDSVLVTCYAPFARRGYVYQLWLDGRTREIATGPWRPSGVATDGKRVFVGEGHGCRVLCFPLRDE